MRKLHAQREAETNAILARDKQENLAGTVSMVVGTFSPFRAL